MIHLIVGYMGSGKSLYAVRWIWRNRRKYKSILTNTPLKIDNVIFANNPIKAVTKAQPPILLFLDEAHFLLDSRRSMSKQNLDWTHLLTVLRKLQVDLIMTTQSLRQVDIRLRTLLRTFWVARGIHYLETSEGNEPFFIYEQYAVRMDPWTGEPIKFWLRTDYLWWENAKLYFDLYDTAYIPIPSYGDDEEEEKIPAHDLVGTYNSAEEIMTYLRALGFRPTRANYRQILRRLGLSVRIYRNSKGKRFYEVKADLTHEPIMSE